MTAEALIQRMWDRARDLRNEARFASRKADREKLLAAAAEVSGLASDFNRELKEER